MVTKVRALGQTGQEVHPLSEAPGQVSELAAMFWDRTDSAAVPPENYHLGD